jgi:hypothetical protein
MNLTQTADLLGISGRGLRITVERGEIEQNTRLSLALGFSAGVH